MSVTCKALMVTVICGSWFASAAQKIPYSDTPLRCSDFSLSELADVSVLLVRGVALTSYDDRSLSPATVRNMSDRPIESVLLLIEFLDVEGNHVETGAYYATTHRFPDQLLRVQQGYGIQRLVKPLEPNKDLSLTAVSDMVLLSCPAKAVVSNAAVRFSDGSTWSRSSPTWLTDPVFREATVDMSDFPKALPFAFWATVELSSSGHATVVETEQHDEQVRTWLQKQLDTWSIDAGDRGPLASDTQRFAMLVRVNGRRANHLGRKWMLESHRGNSPLIVVDIARSESRSR